VATTVHRVMKYFCIVTVLHIIALYIVSYAEYCDYYCVVQCFCFEEQRLNPHEEVRVIRRLLYFLLHLMYLLLVATFVLYRCKMFVFSFDFVLMTATW